MNPPAPASVRVLDVVHGATLVVPRSSPVLRVPYDLFHPAGPVEVEEGLVTYGEVGGEVRRGRVVETTLAEVHAGERVLLQLPYSGERLWWLCEMSDERGD